MVEWKGTADHSVGYAPETPDIAGQRILVLSEHFRGDIAKGSERLIGKLVGTQDTGKPEVDDFRHCLIPMIRHHYIFKFEVSMHNAINRHVLYCGSQLEAYVASSVLSQPEKTHFHVLIEILPVDLLKNYISVVHGLEQINEPVDVRMAEDLQNISLPPQLVELNILHFLLPYNLDSYLCPVI